MNNHFKQITIQALEAKDLIEIEEIQSLWSGYGSIKRLKIIDGAQDFAIVKHVKPPNKTSHPRGWNSSISHLRKVKSYDVECRWYKDYASLCNDLCKVPQCYVMESKENEVFMVLEDLHHSGYSQVLSSVSWNEIKTCLRWFANFHATFLNKEPLGLWPIGTYWHLKTRPDELEALTDYELKSAAPAIDAMLNAAKYQTLVHGDAKIANFCFSKDGNSVAAVDFQYVGSGCGMKDIVYFIGSCLYEEDCEKLEAEILNYYFNELKKAASQQALIINMEELESEWRTLYPVAWTDFHRFIKGWSPGHWKINSYSEKLSRKVIKNLI